MEKILSLSEMLLLQEALKDFVKKHDTSQPSLEQRAKDLYHAIRGATTIKIID